MRLRYCLSLIAFTTIASTAHAAWQYAHGDSANTGFEMVGTAPATAPSTLQPLGSIAPGANPVVGPNGDVYIGNLEGELRAFHADGRPYWTRKINNLQGGFYAAPVVGADGSVYAVSSVHYTDHQDGQTKHVYESYLHKFSPDGAWVFWKPFPVSSLYPFVGRGATTAPPNIWRWNGAEAIIVPAVYKGLGGEDLRLIAFSTAGVVLGDKVVTHTSYEISGGSGLPAPDWLVTCYALTWYYPSFCFLAAAINGDLGFTGSGDYLPLSGAGIPLPGVAIRPDPLGGSPLIMMTDARHDKVVYNFSPQGGFFPVARSSHLLRQFTTPPVALPNGDTLTGTLDGYLTRTRSNFTENFVARGLGTLTAAPTRLSDGSLVVISREGTMTVQRAHRSEIQLAGESIASAAASCSHFFVATVYDFSTFDAKTLAWVASVPWTGGGLHSPVIGIYGNVYAIASNTLYVFPAPARPFPGMPPPLSCSLAPPVLAPQ